MPTVNQSIKSYLQAQLPRHNGCDLLERVVRHLPDMEMQINVSAGDGDPVEGKRSTYTDGIDEWWNIRIPKNADSEPEWHDYELRWPLDAHVEAIGSTGWDWQAQCSRWVGFDVDSITNHAAGVGITDEELKRVKKAAEALPYVEVRKSTGGRGVHLYVYFSSGIPTENHTVHAALSRCVLGMMSSETGFDFASQIDACGGNMWVWHRKTTPENEGLKLIKPAERALSVEDLPPNWRDHIEVVTRRRSKIKIDGLDDTDEGPFEALASSNRRVALDDSHRAIIEELTRSSYSTVWVPDFHLLQTHTKALQNLLDDPDRRSALKLKGFYQTLSDGRHPATCNCFAFPMEDGVFRVYRFSPGTPETEMWEQDGEGWTTCYFNKSPDLAMASRAGGGVEAPNNAGYVFAGAKDAVQVIEVLGQKIAVPEQLEQRETRLRTQKDGRIVISVKKENPNEVAPEGWLSDRGKLTKVLSIKSEMSAQAANESYTESDKVVRALVSPDGKRAGWSARTFDGAWVEQPKDDIKSTLIYHGRAKPEVEIIVGSACVKPWRLVKIPFQPEYPGNRQWNRGAPQYRHQPATLSGDAAPFHPHWDMILRHCFCDLDATIKDDPWAQRASVKTGADYGLLWMACLLRNPYQHLPYLFFYGDEDCGKSIFHESFEYLITKGRVSAYAALTNQNGFNGELAGAILGFVDEGDISRAPGALAKLKEWIMAPMMAIRQMRTDTYMLPNTFHGVQTGNSPDVCPVMPGDTRITMMFVPPLSEDVKVPRHKMEMFLIQEAPHFMRTIMDVTLPKVEGRIGVPVIETRSKTKAQEKQRSQLEQFIQESCFKVVGSRILFTEFCDRFLEWLPPDEVSRWSKQRISRELPENTPAGVHTGNKKYVGNLSWEDIETTTGAFEWISSNGRLRVK
jgi:hypothetical protein